VVPDKTVEGSAAFLIATMAVATGVLWASTTVPPLPLLGASFGIALAAAVLEMLPLRIDDNLTIPLFVGFVAWIACALFGVPID
jgi:dolichol kinase